MRTAQIGPDLRLEATKNTNFLLGCLCGPVKRSALVNIRRKALLSSVGFRKRMTLPSPRGSYLPVTHVSFALIVHSWFVWWSDVCFELLSCFFDHPSIDSIKRCYCICLDVLMFRPHQASSHIKPEGPCSGCYCVTSLQWPPIEWYSLPPPQLWLWLSLSAWWAYFA